jgi:beta-glucosidase
MVRYIYLYNQIYIEPTNLQGFVISDWQGLDRITSPEHADYLLSIKLGILAGIDMV